ncbi:MAG: DNA translocase FtsK 4TM domain-containing protein, partial [Clostridiales bacterium]|nr:DNA translocase FtsK 4TM domain-containing protein [Clostridiales bacterium]
MAVKKDAGRPPSGQNNARKAPARKGENNSEIISILVIAVSILLLVAVFSPGTAGVFGLFVNGLLCGLFGVGAYIGPFLAIAISVFFIVSKKNVSVSEIVMFFSLVIIILSFAHILTVDEDVVYLGVGDYIKSNYEHGGLQNGGLIGAVFGNFFMTVLGKVGAYIVMSAASLIIVIVLTGRSVVELIGNTYSNAKEKLASRRDEYEDSYEIEYMEEEEVYEKPVKQRRTETNGTVRPSRPSVDFIIYDEKKPKGERILLPGDETRKKPKPTMALGSVPTFEEGSGKNNLEEFEGNPKYDMEDGYRIDIKGLEDFDDGEVEIKAAGEIVSPVIRGAADGEVRGSIKADALKTPTALHKADEPVRPVEPVVKAASPNVENIPGRRLTKKEQLEIENEKMIAQISIEAAGTALEEKPYEFPPVDLLAADPGTGRMGSKAQILENSKKLEETLKSFGVEARVVEVSKGPTVTRYELSPGQGVKVSRISSLADDLALNLAAQGIRIEAPIPGKAAVGIEVPNKEAQTVYFRDIVEDEAFKRFPSKLAFGLGKDIAGKVVVSDIARMPHLLIAGATGSGKSVCINTLIGSILYKARPDEVKLIMVDP